MPLAATQPDDEKERAILASKLLIIDDEPLNVSVLRRMLENADYSNIFSTNDPRESLELFIKHDPDLVLLDFRMPYLNGLEVLEEISKLDTSHSVPVLMLTAEYSKELRLRALEAGAKDFVNKPFDRTEVMNRIHNLLETRQLYNYLKHRNNALDQIVQERTSKLQQEQAALADLNIKLEEKVDERTVDLQEANSKLERVNNAMTELVSIVSHELRTPLTSIKSFAEILRDEDDKLDTESKKHFLTIINDESDRLSRLISDLLDLQKISSGKMVWKQDVVDLVKSVTDTVEFFTPAYNDKKLSITFKANIEKALTLTDSDKTRQVLSNLLSNALKFTETGCVDITLGIENTWAKMLLLSDDAQTCSSLNTILGSNNTTIISMRCQEEAAIYLQNNETVIDAVIADISACDGVDASFIEYLREQHPMLPIATILEGQRAGDEQSVNNHCNAIYKPINEKRDEGAIRLLIADLIGLCPTTPMISIAIKDTGAGIPDNQLNKIFVRFHQVDTSQVREQRGTGLGLSICQEIINHYNGKIWVESTLGEGSTFYLQLPQLKAQKKRIGEILVEKGLVTKEQLSKALTDQ